MFTFKRLSIVVTALALVHSIAVGNLLPSQTKAQGEAQTSQSSTEKYASIRFGVWPGMEAVPTDIESVLTFEALNPDKNLIG
jgi:Na+/H+-dicarboxylate symporter